MSLVPEKFNRIGVEIYALVDLFQVDNDKTVCVFKHILSESEKSRTYGTFYLLLRPAMEKYTNSTHPVETPQKAASDRSKHCLLTDITMQNTIKKKSFYQKSLNLETGSSLKIRRRSPLVKQGLISGMVTRDDYILRTIKSIFFQVKSKGLSL